MNKILQATTSIHMQGSPEWVHILPIGMFAGNDGRGPYLMNNAEAIIQASTRPKTDMVVDRDHEIMFAAQGTHKPAAAWIKELESREDGIWGRVEWTPSAKEQLKNKEYRYLSPVFGFDKETREITKIHHVSLTNDPNLELTAVASAFRNPPSNIEKKEENTMNKQLLAIAAALGLASTATAEEVVQATEDLVAVNQQVQKDYASAVKALGLDEKADNETVVETASQKIETISAGAKPDPSEYVPMSAHKELSNNFAALQKTVHQDKSTIAVNSAMKDGKISPAQKEWATDYASKDPEGFANYIAAAPKIVAEEGKTSHSKEGGTSKLSDEDTAVCEQLGISQEDFSKTEIKEEAA